MAKSQIVDNLQVQLGAAIDKAMGQTLAQWERQNMGAAQKAAASFKSFDAAVGKAHNSLLSFRNLAVVGLVTGLGAMVARVLNSADAIQDAAEAAGLSTTRFQELRFAFQFAGVSAENFGSSMARFAKNVGEASQGNDDLIETFKRLGVSIYDASGNLRTQDAILNDTIDGLAGIKDQATRSAEAYALFGREAGAKFAGAIGQGSDAIAALVQKARDMNLILDEDTVKAAAAASDAIDTLGTVIGVRLTNAIAAAAPGIQKIVNAIAWLIEPFERPGNDLSKIAGVTRELQELAAQEEAILSGADAGTRRASEGQKSEALDILSRRRNALIARLELLRQEKRIEEQEAAGNVGSLDQMQGKSAASKAKAAADQWLEKQREVYDAGQDLMRSNIEAEDAMELAQLTRRMEALAGFEKQKFAAREAYEQAVDELNEERTRKEKDTAERVADAWGSSLRSVVNNIDILFDRSMSRTERLTRFALDSIMRVAEAAATQMGGGQDPYKQAGGWVAQALGSLFGGSPTGTGTLVGGGGQPLATLAEGGPLDAFQPAIVGERGRELIVPRVPSLVLPNRETERRLGGGERRVVTQHFVFHVGTGASEAAEVIRRELPRIMSAAKAGVMDDLSRNRALAKQVR